MEKNQMKAIGKVAGGAYEVITGVLTTAGTGLAGKYLRERDMMNAAGHLGTTEIKNGAKTFVEGLRELKR